MFIKKKKSKKKGRFDKQKDLGSFTAYWVL